MACWSLSRAATVCVPNAVGRLAKTVRLGSLPVLAVGYQAATCDVRYEMITR